MFRFLLPLALCAATAWAQSEPLQLDRPVFPEQHPVTKPLRIQLSGAGADNVEFREVTYTLEKRRILIRARGVPSSSPATPFTAELTIPPDVLLKYPLMGIVVEPLVGEVDWNYVWLTRNPNPPDGVFSGRVLGSRAGAFLKLKTGRLSSILFRLPKGMLIHQGDYVVFRGGYAGPETLRVDSLLIPTYETLEARVKPRGQRKLAFDDGSELVAVGKLKRQLPKGKRVKLEAWVYRPAGYARVTRVRATLKKDLSEGRWFLKGSAVAGSEVWITRRRLLGRWLTITRDDGTLEGQVRKGVLSVERATPGPGLVGGLSTQ